MIGLCQALLRYRTSSISPKAGKINIFPVIPPSYWRFFEKKEILSRSDGRWQKGSNVENRISLPDYYRDSVGMALVVCRLSTGILREILFSTFDPFCLGPNRSLFSGRQSGRYSLSPFGPLRGDPRPTPRVIRAPRPP